MAFKFFGAAAALAATALASNTTGPYTIHVTGKGDTSIDGMLAPLATLWHTHTFGSA